MVTEDRDAPGDDGSRVVTFVVDFAPSASLLDQVGLTQDLGVLLGTTVDVVSRPVADHDLVERAEPL